MGLRISGKNLDMGDALRTHIEGKIDILFNRFGEKKPLGHIVLKKEGTGFRSDCVLILSNGTNIAADGISHDPYSAFEQALDRIERRMRRYKNRQKAKHHSDDNAPQSVAEQIIEFPDETENDGGDHSYSPIIIAETHKKLQSLTVANAVWELDVTGSHVVVFRHAGNGRVNFVYRRPDGHIGWIDPDSATY